MHVISFGQKHKADPNTLDVEGTPMVVYPIMSMGEAAEHVVTALLRHGARLGAPISFNNSDTVFEFCQTTALSPRIKQILLDSHNEPVFAWKEDAPAVKRVPRVLRHDALADIVISAGPAQYGGKKRKTVEPNAAAHDVFSAVAVPSKPGNTSSHDHAGSSQNKMATCTTAVGLHPR